MKRLIFVIAVLALSGCTTTQVNEGMQWAAGEIITNALDIAIGSGKGDEREYEPGRYRPCDHFCEYQEEVRIEAAYAEHERRERRAEARAFKAEFDEFMTQLEEAERASTNSPVIIVTTTSSQMP